MQYSLFDVFALNLAVDLGQIILAAGAEDLQNSCKTLILYRNIANKIIFMQVLYK